MNAEQWAIEAQKIASNGIARCAMIRSAVSRFADEMEKELIKHDDEYSFQPWSKSDHVTLEEQARQHLYILRRLIADKRRGNEIPDAEIKKRAAHVANYMMMISDNLVMGRVK